MATCASATPSPKVRICTFTGIPSFAPELMRRARADDPMKAKHLSHALEQLAEEGAARIFKPLVDSNWIVGVVGALQFDVLADRIRTEYDVPVKFEDVALYTARWMAADDPAVLKTYIDQNRSAVAHDHDGDPVFLARKRLAFERYAGQKPEHPLPGDQIAQKLELFDVGCLNAATFYTILSPIMAATEETIDLVQNRAAYTAGFVTDIESEKAPKGLSEDTVRFISAKKNEPQWLLDWRLKAFARWQKMPEPRWAKLQFPEIDYQDAYYYAAPKTANKPKSLDEVDPRLLETYEKLGIPLREREALAGVAVDVVFDSVSVATTFREELAAVGIIFCSIGEAVQNHPDLVRQYLGTVVPYSDNKHACLNSAVFTDGSFVYIPPGVRCPMELSTYFRINELNTGQFERTLIIADKGSFVSYLEGCTAPMRDERQMHAAVVELITHDDAEIKYSTVQNWFPGDENGKGGIYNFVTKRGLCEGRNSRIAWTQVETGSAITWKYPSCILKGDNSVGEFYSVAVTNNFQQARHRHQDDPFGPEH